MSAMFLMIDEYQFSDMNESERKAVCQKLIRAARINVEPSKNEINHEMRKE